MRTGRIEVSGGFLLLIAWLNYLDRQGIVPLALLACVLHELGHYAAIRALGGAVRRLRLTAVGAELELSGPLSCTRECLAALAGPGVNLLLALLACRQAGGALFAGLNLALACLNLLPVRGLDGGRALRCALTVLVSGDAAERAGEGLDLLLTVSALALGVWLAGECGNVTLLLTAAWLLSRCAGAKMGVAISH